MAASDKSQHAIRRSTRLPLEVPVRVSSLNPECPFSEECNTTLVNAHGCGLISHRPPAHGLRVRIEIVSAKRHTTAQVAEVVPLGGNPETWLVGLELDAPGNFWGIEYAPSDWKAEEELAPIPRPAVADTPKPTAGISRRWRLTDISGGACYLESTAPLPAGTPVLISVRSLDKEYLLEGTVRASHAQAGMGVEFLASAGQRGRIEDLIAHLMSHREAPKIFVGRKEGRQAAQSEDQPVATKTDESGIHEPDAEDPLLDLVRQGSVLSVEQFQSDLRAQRLGKRRDPRIDIALPVLLKGVDVKGRPLDQRVVTVNISRRGALLEGVHGVLNEGDKVTLARGAKKEEFRVAWIVDDDTATGARIGVAAVDPNSSFWDEVLAATSQSGLEQASLRNNAEAG